MKIGFVLDDGLDKEDGVQQYILTLGRQFRSKGHEVRYLVGQTARTDLDGVYSMARNIKVRFNGNGMSIPAISSKKNITKVLEKERFDVLHVQTPYSPFMGARVVRMAKPGTLIVGTFHILPYNFSGRIGTRLLGFALRPSLRKFAGFISVSRPAADFAKKTFNIDSQIIPNTVDTAKFRPKNQSKKCKDELRLVFLGRLFARKGCLTLLKSLAILNNENNLPANLRLDVAGDGDQRALLEKFVADNHLGPFVAFHGYVSEDKKVDLLQKADISVFPSVAGESFGIVLIEAIAAGGGIVLAGDNPGYRSVMADYPDSIIDPRSPTVLAKQLSAFIQDETKREKLYRQQQQDIDRYDASLVAEKILSFYATCKKGATNQ